MIKFLLFWTLGIFIFSLFTFTSEFFATRKLLILFRQFFTKKSTTVFSFLVEVTWKTTLKIRTEVCPAETKHFWTIFRVYFISLVTSNRYDFNLKQEINNDFSLTLKQDLRFIAEFWIRIFLYLGAQRCVHSFVLFIRILKIYLCHFRP